MLAGLSALAPFYESIARGLFYTLVLTILPAIGGTLLGLIFAPALAERYGKPAFWAATGVVEVVRAIPPLVWLVWAYFALPILLSVRLSPLAAALLVFTTIYAAFAADIFRGAIRSIPTSTIDSALAIGMSERLVARRVLLPEILRRSFAALNGQTIGLLKMSSLASIIAVPELTYSFQLILIRRPLPFEVYTGMALAYCLLVFPSVWLLRKVEATNLFSLNPASRVKR